MVAAAPPASAPPSRPPRIPETLVDGPTQRLYAVSAFLLVQSFKLADFVFTLAAGHVDDSDVNWKLVQWFLVDLVLLMILQWLRIPRLSFGWKGVWLARISLYVLDWVLFGRWEITASSFLPKSLQALLVTSLTTTETSVRLASLFKPETYLGGHYTIHILATSTAQLDPQAQAYCLSDDVQGVEPIYVPILVNNTIPASITYTITDLDDPEQVTTRKISASELKKRAKKARQSDISDEDRELESWGIVVQNPKKQAQAVRHALPSTAQTALDVLEHLAPSQQVLYLPVKEPGYIQLESVTDRDGSPVRIRKIRDKRRTDAFQPARILRCPKAGFAKSETHQQLCINGAVPALADIDFAVRGVAPLSLTYSVISPTGATTKETVSSIPSSSSSDIVTVPRTLHMSRSGRYTVRLDSITDGGGNTVILDSHGIISSFERVKTIDLFERPTVAFEGACAKGEDVRLSERQKSSLRLRVSQPSMPNLPSGPFAVKLRETTEQGVSSIHDVQVDQRIWEKRLESPGTWEVLSVRGACEGLVTSPSTCSVVLQPRPTVATTFEPILDACSAEIGVTATLLFSGTPPFKAAYSIQRKGSTAAPQRKTISIQHNREQVRIEPGQGVWEYRFEKIGDYHYGEHELDDSEEYSFTQRILPVGSARWLSKEKKIDVHSCQGDKISLQVALEGTAPWELEYTIVGQKPRMIRNINDPHFTFDVEIPPSIATRGGQFAVSLVSVKDANGCRKPLSLDDLAIDVHRTVPTARFHGAGDARKSTLLEGEKGRIPVRLAGEGPWIVTYEAPADSSGREPKQVEIELKNTNAEIVLAKPVFGRYKLVGVRDKYCPGTVTDADWSFSSYARPTLRLAETTGELVRNGSIVRAPVCAGRPDSFEVLFDGKAPFQADYTVSKNGHEVSKKTLSAIGYRSQEPLWTDEAGHYAYQFSGLADGLYSSISSQGLQAPAGGQDGVVRVEQDVFAVPSARFSALAPEHFCVGDKLRARSKDELQLHLDGKAPFEVDFVVRQVGSKREETFSLKDIKKHALSLDLPFQLDSVSTYDVSIKRIRDANGCEQSSDGLDKDSRVSVSVAEIATITPATSAVDQCVGEYLDFTIQGTPPFTVTYEFDGKRHEVPNGSSQFRRLATTPGEFKIVGVGHKQNRCQSRPTNIVKRVHAVPTARVSNGDAVIMDIHEGDQAEIVFSFVGTPPFSMTYSRRHPRDRSKERTVLETHTVTGITTSKYSIFTSQEGTWSVDYIADAYCAYPRAEVQSDATVRKV